MEMQTQETLCLEQHTSNVSDICWSSEATRLISGSYDHTAKEWDVASGKMVASFDVEGFVQSVCYNPADDRVFYIASTSKSICTVDVRAGKIVSVLANEAMVNSIFPYRDGTHLLSGDKAGCIRLWDLQKQSALECASLQTPISHLHACPGSSAEEEGRFLAVNCYDNVLRVFDRRTRGSFNVSSDLRVVHQVHGHKNKHWPIRSAFFQGSQYQHSWGEGAAQRAQGAPSRDKSIHRSLLLATGSADCFAYVYDVGGPEDTGELVQRLQGHTDRVYAADFHPTEPFLATCSADFTVKIWAPKVKTATSIKEPLQ